MAQLVFVPAASGSTPAGNGFEFTQASPALTWIVNHNLGYNPVVTVLSVGGLMLDASVLHTSVNQVQITFLSPTAGSVRCV